MKPSGPVFDAEWRTACIVRPVTKTEADPCIRAHYLGKWPGVVVCRLGLFRGTQLLGVIVFALPPRESDKRYGGKTWELARLWVADFVPSNAETFLIGRAVKYVKKNHKDVRVLVSYADPSAGHEGVIYRAANWQPDGRTDQERKTPRFDYGDARTGKRYSRRKHVPSDAVIVRIPRISKNRFYLRVS